MPKEAPLHAVKGPTSWNAACQVEMGAALETAIASGLDVVVDLTPTGYINSTGLRAIADTQTRLKETGNTLTVIIPPDSKVDRVLTIVGLKNVLDNIIGTIDDITTS